MKDGILIINKPKGMTSHDVVDFVRRRLKIRRVGHSGTLDPLASGVLLLLVGKATKLFNYFVKFDKEYIATLTFGKRTTSGDAEGEVIETSTFEFINEERARRTFAKFVGEKEQVPPMISAIKFKGSPLYALARKGFKIQPAPRRIKIKELKVLKFLLPDIQFYLKCSKGTYVRALAEDIARDLDCVGYISQIQRQSVGPFHINQAIELAQVDESHIQQIFP
ncbi:MAG: tRNA pseudouridine(55) synthase TruB [Candidatus Omnitrophica bacterium]|nr:tRNA pseudouridine(55) synthase TruB [Candidatus Omnitrophota bacterium]